MNVIWDMTIGEIGQIAGLSTAVVISLILGVRALRQTKELQEKQFKHEEELRLREQRQKLFDEIIDWAIDITRVGTTRTIADMSYAHLGYELHAVELMYFETLRYEFQEVYSRSDYVAIIAIRFTEETQLQKNVRDTRLTLYQHLRLLELVSSDKIKNLKAIGTHRTKLVYSALGVIIEATKIKTEGIT